MKTQIPAKAHASAPVAHSRVILPMPRSRTANGSLKPSDAFVVALAKRRGVTPAEVLRQADPNPVRWTPAKLAKRKQAIAAQRKTGRAPQSHLQQADFLEVKLLEAAIEELGRGKQRKPVMAYIGGFDPAIIPLLQSRLELAQNRVIRGY